MWWSYNVEWMNWFRMVIPEYIIGHVYDSWRTREKWLFNWYAVPYTWIHLCYCNYIETVDTLTDWIAYDDENADGG